MKQIISNLIFGITLFTQDINAEIVRRAAFDFGSGSIKMQVADIETEEQTIIKSHLSQVILISFNEDLLENRKGEFSEKLLTQALEAVKTLRDAADQYDVKEFGGFATEAFRQAQNSSELFKTMEDLYGIPVRLVSQQEEGELGFNTAVILGQEDPHHVVVWDTGAGSAQFTTLVGDAIQVLKIPAGAITAAKLIISDIQGKEATMASSPNPMTAQEAADGIVLIQKKLPELSPEWMHYLKEKAIITIGAQPRSVVVHGKIHTIEQVKLGLEKRLYKSDEELSNDPEIEGFNTGSFLLAYSTMQKYGIERVKHIRAGTGNTAAFLVNQKYWELIRTEK